MPNLKPDIWNINGVTVNVTQNLRDLAARYAASEVPVIIENSGFETASPIMRQARYGDLKESIGKDNPALLFLRYDLPVSLAHWEANQTIDELPLEERARRFLIHSKVMFRLLNEEIDSLELDDLAVVKVKRKLCAVHQQRADSSVEELAGDFKASPRK